MKTRWFEKLAARLKSRKRWRMITRERDGKDEDYLERFYILSTKWLGIYLHRFWADDDDGLHDHPWNSVSILLSGAYMEEMPERELVPYGPSIKKLRYPLHPPIHFRSRYAAHRITIPNEATNETEAHYIGQPIWSLFIRFGLKRRIWGFWRYGLWEPAEVQSRKDEVEQAHD